MKLACAVLSGLLAVGVCAQEKHAEPPQYRYVDAYRYSTLQQNLNNVAKDGYRLSRAQTGRSLNRVADFLLSGAAGGGGVVARMERTTEKYEYVVVLKPTSASNWEKEINLHATEGFRVVPGFTIGVKRGVVIGTLEEIITVMERGPERTPMHYFALQAHGVDGFSKSVSQRLAEGARLLWMGRWGEWQVGLLESDEKVTSSVFISGNEKNVFKEMESRGREGFRLMYYIDRLGMLEKGTAAYLEKSPQTVEYKVLPNKKSSREAFSEAAGQGFQFSDSLGTERSMVLTRSEADRPWQPEMEESPSKALELGQSGHRLVASGAWLGHAYVAILEKTPEK